MLQRGKRNASLFVVSFVLGTVTFLIFHHSLGSLLVKKHDTLTSIDLVAKTISTTQQVKLGIITATRSSKRWTNVSNTLLNKVLLPSLKETITDEEALAWDINLFLGIDDNDTFWNKAFDADPTGLQLTNKPLFLQIHPIFVRKAPNRKDKIPFNEAAKAAFDEGAEYYVRINDDTEFITPNWITKGTISLQSFLPQNVGVVGPLCRDGNTEILTHDMVHRTHLQIFNGTYYPNVFNNWWLDDWITLVYSTENLGGIWNNSLVLVEWKVRHHIEETRYKVHHGDKKHLESELHRGKERILSYINTHGIDNPG